MPVIGREGMRTVLEDLVRVWFSNARDGREGARTVLEDLVRVWFSNARSNARDWAGGHENRP